MYLHSLKKFLDIFYCVKIQYQILSLILLLNLSQILFYFGSISSTFIEKGIYLVSLKKFCVSTHFWKHYMMV